MPEYEEKKKKKQQSTHSLSRDGSQFHINNLREFADFMHNQPVPNENFKKKKRRKDQQNERK